eukprot:CAMPEP_0206301814 /NCGR_PEP_ID=MMETSP0106_2-20121207/8406_1 /ASSEMBLY_ACC=CAM_ASM_000206 /TAXON_ID=81532 /ORGANISM="Acanthoeca-like sp., Strain 10tr" /LENGTH=1431 /DNA_ID=CAMNT_0053732571 /DNA_START=85 /DNA_END=4381 /DNA_ORIENTATION=-
MSRPSRTGSGGAGGPYNNRVNYPAGRSGPPHGSRGGGLGHTLGKAGSRKPIPKPVALPSIRKENFGLDPSVNLIAASGGSGWANPKGKTSLGGSPLASRKESVPTTTTPQPTPPKPSPPKTWKVPTSSPKLKSKPRLDPQFPSLGQESTTGSAEAWGGSFAQLSGISSERRASGPKTKLSSAAIPKSVGALAGKDAAFKKDDDSWVDNDDVDFSANPFGDIPAPEVVPSTTERAITTLQPPLATHKASGPEPKANSGTVRDSADGPAERPGWDDSQGSGPPMPPWGGAPDGRGARPWGDGLDEKPRPSRSMGQCVDEPQSLSRPNAWGGDSDGSRPVTSDDVRTLEGVQADGLNVPSDPEDASSHSQKHSQPQLQLATDDVTLPSSRSNSAKAASDKPESGPPDEDEIEKDRAEMLASIERARARRQQEEEDRIKRTKRAAQAKLEALERRRRQQELEHHASEPTQTDPPKQITLFQRGNLTGGEAGRVSRSEADASISSRAKEVSPWESAERPSVDKNPWTTTPSEDCRPPLPDHPTPTQVLRQHSAEQRQRPPTSVWSLPQGADAMVGIDEPSAFMKPLTAKEAETRPSAEGKKLFDPYEGEKGVKRPSNSAIERAAKADSTSSTSERTSHDKAPGVNLQQRAQQAKERDVRVCIKGKVGHSKMPNKNVDVTAVNDVNSDSNQGRRHNRHGKPSSMVNQNEVTIRMPKVACRAGVRGGDAVVIPSRTTPQEGEEAHHANVANTEYLPISPDSKLKRSPDPQRHNAWTKPLSAALAAKASAVPSGPSRAPSNLEDIKSRDRKIKKSVEHTKKTSDSLNTEDAMRKSTKHEMDVAGSPVAGPSAGPAAAVATVGGVDNESLGESSFSTPAGSESLAPEGGLGGLAHIWTDQPSDSMRTPPLPLAAGASLSGPSLAAPSIWDSNGAGATPSSAVPMTSLQQAFAQPSMPHVPTAPWSGGYSNPVTVPVSESHPSAMEVASGKSTSSASGQSAQHVHAQYRPLVSQGSQPYFAATAPYSGSRVQLVVPGGGLQLIQQASADYAVYQQPTGVVYADQSTFAVTSHLSRAHRAPPIAVSSAPVVVTEDGAEHELSADAPTFEMPQGDESHKVGSGDAVQVASLGSLPAAAPSNETSKSAPNSGTTAQLAQPVPPTYVNQHAMRVQPNIQSVVGAQYQYPAAKYVQQPLMYPGEYTHFQTAYMQGGGGTFDTQYSQLAANMQFQDVGQIGSTVPVGNQRTQGRAGQRGALPDTLIPHLGNVSVLGESKVKERSSSSGHSVKNKGSKRHHTSAQPSRRQEDDSALDSVISSSLFGAETKVKATAEGLRDGSGPCDSASGTDISSATEKSPAPHELEILYTFESSFPTPPKAAAMPAPAVPVNSGAREAPVAPNVRPVATEVALHADVADRADDLMTAGGGVDGGVEALTEQERMTHN